MTSTANIKVFALWILSGLLNVALHKIVQACIVFQGKDDIDSENQSAYFLALLNVALHKIEQASIIFLGNTNKHRAYHSWQLAFRNPADFMCEIWRISGEIRQISCVKSCGFHLKSI